MDSLSTTPTTTDATRATLLIRLNQTGPEREVAWSAFHDLYAPVISGFARRMGARGDEVEDLVQEVLKAFFCVTPEFTYDPAKGRFRGYLKTCVWHKLSELRRRRRPELLGAREVDDIAVDAVWDDVWETEKLGRALAVVRERYSINAERQRTFRAFEMCALLERPVEQVAAELGLSAQSVRAARSRVSKAVREAFEGLDD